MFDCRPRHFRRPMLLGPRRCIRRGNRRSSISIRRRLLPWTRNVHALSERDDALPRSRGRTEFAFCREEAGVTACYLVRRERVFGRQPTRMILPDTGENFEIDFRREPFSSRGYRSLLDLRERLLYVTDE